MRRLNLVIVLVVPFLQSCYEADNNLEERLKYFSDVFESRDIKKLDDICVGDGYSTILDWSDSLRNMNYLKNVSECLSSTRKISVQVEDDKTIIGLGKDFTSESRFGYLILVKVQGVYYIQSFKGAK